MNLDDENVINLTTVPGEYEATAIVSALEADLPRAQQVLADLKAHGAGIDWSQVDVDDPNAGGGPAEEA